MEVEPDLFCRLCLGSVTSDDLIFSEEDECGIPLASKIMLCTSLVVSKSDDKPKYICSICAKMIEMFFEFRDRCFKTHMELSAGLGNSRNLKSSDQERCNTYKNTICQRKEKIAEVFEIETGCEGVENVMSIEECNTSDQMGLQNQSYSLEISEIISCAGQERDEAVIEHVQESEKEHMFKEEVQEIQNLGKEDVNNLDVLDTVHQFQVGCYVDLKENCEDSNDNSEPTLLRRFKCMTCLKVFPSLAHLDDHWEECERNEQPEFVSQESTSQELVSQDNGDCRDTNDINSKESTLCVVESQPGVVVNNRQSYNKNKNHVCELCKKTFPKVILLRKHVFKEHATRERCFACSVCPRRFIDKYELKYHMRIHSDKDGFQCKICLKKFARPSALRTHERMHTGEKPFMCDMCPQTFTQLYSLMTHERIHTGEKPYMCQYCSRAFAQHSSLRKHERLHAGGAKMFQCDICRRMYANNSELELHLSTHSGELPWKCSICKTRAFRKPSELSKHMLRFHSENRPFQCSLCDKSFTFAHELKSHGITHLSEKLFECLLCGKQYKNKLTLRRHLCKSDMAENEQICENEMVDDELNISENLKD